MKKTHSAGGVVTNGEGEVLVVSQRGTSWSLPKGHIDAGENALVAAKRGGHLFAWMRSAGTSTSVTPRKENKSFTRYMGGCSEVCFTM